MLIWPMKNILQQKDLLECGKKKASKCEREIAKISEADKVSLRAQKQNKMALLTEFKSKRKGFSDLNLELASVKSNVRKIEKDLKSSFT